jgi:hypothetical protein
MDRVEEQNSKEAREFERRETLRMKAAGGATTQPVSVKDADSAKVIALLESINRKVGVARYG